MKQTAAQWLEECIKIGLTYEQEVMFEGLFQQAKEMNLEEIKQAYEDGKRDAYKQDDVPTAEEYIYQKYKL
jgi:hypothetical protein